MITRCRPAERALVLLASLQLVLLVHSSSLAAGGKQAAHTYQQQQQHQPQPQQPSTALPPLLTTIALENSNYPAPLKAAAAKLLQSHHNYQQPQQQHQQQQQEGTKQAPQQQHDEPDELPLATINNHSRNNQVAALRPPHYVDVSALVGPSSASSSASSSSSRNISSLSSMGSSSFGASAPNSMLSPKSRSGLPECATQQVCNAIFVRMNHTQRLCECSSNYNWKCSNNLDPQDGHTIELTRKFDKRIYTQIKTCEPLREVRACKSPTDWTLLALQSERSGKAHYVVVCKCPTWAQLEGPYTHNHPPYANIPGIRVYGMLCAHQTARSSSAQTYAAYNPALSIYPEFPWNEALNVLNTTNLASAAAADAAANGL